MENMGKWNNIFWLFRANQWELFLPFFISFPISLIRAINGFVKNEQQILVQIFHVKQVDHLNIDEAKWNLGKVKI